MLEKAIKSILPASGVEKLKKLVEGITNSTLRVAGSSRLLDLSKNLESNPRLA